MGKRGREGGSVRRRGRRRACIGGEDAAELADFGEDVDDAAGADEGGPDDAFYLGIMKLARRFTFMIDPQGNIAKVYLSVRLLVILKTSLQT